MKKLIVTKGLPGSGKTTWAREQGLLRVNRDDLRAMLLPEWPYDDDTLRHRYEGVVTAAQNSAVSNILMTGQDVIVDDTNLRGHTLLRWRTFALRLRAEFVVQDFTGIPIEVCIQRDLQRTNPVGSLVIKRMWDNYQRELNE